MRQIAILAVLALAGCSTPPTEVSVVQLGENRYRATAEGIAYVTEVETTALRAARERCAASSETAEARVVSSRPFMAAISAASASVEFSCVPAQRPRA